MLAYYPYFRGKQYELICIRESASLIAEHGITPIIEIVRTELGSLNRCLSALQEHGAGALIILKPGCGPLKDGLSNELLATVDAAMERNQRLNWLVRTDDLANIGGDGRRPQRMSVLHDVATDSSKVVAQIAECGIDVNTHIFIDGSDGGSLYRTKFRSAARVVVKDGFKRKKNSEYLNPEIEHFSDLHLTYLGDGLQGFGDFLTVGSYYAEGGGQAYAVAVHISFMDPDAEGALFVHHFVSDSNDTPSDPAAKFHEALGKLVAEINSKNCKIARTPAVNEFLDLYRRDHYPGLGYVKKLSMQHHLQLMAGAAQV